MKKVNLENLKLSEPNEGVKAKETSSTLPNLLRCQCGTKPDGKESKVTSSNKDEVLEGHYRNVLMRHYK